MICVITGYDDNKMLNIIVTLRGCERNCSTTKTRKARLNWRGVAAYTSWLRLYHKRMYTGG